MEKKKREELIAVGIIILFLGIAALPSTSAGLLKMQPLRVTLKVENVEHFIIYRFGADGSVKRMLVPPGIENADDLTKALAETCKELCETDTELQHFIKSDAEFFMNVESRGKGFHFALFRPMMRLKPILRVAIFYRYIRFFNDDAYTKVGNNTLAEGPHRGSILGFIGYTGFSTRLIGSVVINGYSMMRVNVESLE